MATSTRTRKRRAILIVDWPRAWRMASVHAAAIACTIGLLPPEQQAALLAMLGVPAERLPLALGILFLAARLLNQPAVSSPAPGAPAALGDAAAGQGATGIPTAPQERL